MSPTITIDPIEARIGQVISFLAAPPQSLRKQLSPSAGEMVSSIAAILEDLVICALEKRTAAEFRAVRKEVFPKYFAAMRALSALTSIVIPDRVLERLTNESFSEMEAECRNHALGMFGAELRDQLFFTIWTLRKTSDLCRQIIAAPVPSDKREDDSEFALQYEKSAVWTRFHTECLLKSMQLGRPPYPEILEEISDSLRTAVNAYAWARRGLELRSPQNDPDPAPVHWDEEEQQLLDEATYDLASER